MKIKKIKFYFRSIFKIVGFFYVKNIFFKWLNYQKFKKDFSKFCSLSSTNRFLLKWEDRYPCLEDNTSNTGFDRHYLYHPAWAARAVKKINPKKHVDISSTLNFSTMLSAFIPVEFYDFRPANLCLTNLESKAANLINLPFPDNSIQSLSCMHVIEHIGLGRYGDTLDPNGDLQAMSELKRVLASNGNLLFVVPVGQPKIQFNAHRIYAYNQIMEFFSELELVEFALISENSKSGGLIVGASEEDVLKETYGCGCFWFRKAGD